MLSTSAISGIVRPAKKRSLTRSAFARSDSASLLSASSSSSRSSDRFLHQEARSFQVDTQATTTVLAPFLAASLFDKDPAHGFRSRGEEMGAAVPSRLGPLAEEPQTVGVHQVRRLPRPSCGVSEEETTEHGIGSAQLGDTELHVPGNVPDEVCAVMEGGD